MTDPATAGLVGRTYTRGRRQPFLIRKWPGSNWVLPLGPYTITQLLVFVASVFLLFSYRHLWAHFGGWNLVIGAGIPVALMYATRHTRVEGRDPLRAALAVGALLLRPRDGYLGGSPIRRSATVRLPAVSIPVVACPQPAGDADASMPPRSQPTAQWVSDLLSLAAAEHTGRT